MKKTFDENIHDSSEEQLNEQDQYAQQSAKELQFLRLTELLKTNNKGCGELLSALYLDESSYSELSEQMGIPEATLRQRKRRCLDKFRAEW